MSTINPKTRWFLCGEEDWDSDDGGVNNEALFNSILSMFNCPSTEEWANATLDEWNR